MFRKIRHSGFMCIAALALMSFSIAPEGAAHPRLVYDVRGAFVAARPEISHLLMLEADRQIAGAIQATTRKIAVPRVVLTVRIDKVAKNTLFFVTRYSADVTVKAAAVMTGDVIARADFSVASFTVNGDTADLSLAGKIAARISSEFGLREPAPSNLATALFAGRSR